MFFRLIQLSVLLFLSENKGEDLMMNISLRLGVKEHDRCIDGFMMLS